MLLVVCATPAEAAAVLDPIRAPRERFDVGPYAAEATATVTTVVCGLGPAAAAAATAVALTVGPYDVVLSVGVAGGFAVPVGALVVADPIVPADVGVLDGGWQAFAAPVPTEAAALAEALAARRGPVLTLATVTSGDDRAAELAARFPGVLAEAMGGYGAACAATAFGIPCHEVRVVSHPVGRQHRSAADLAGALATLTRAVPALVAHLEPGVPA